MDHSKLTIAQWAEEDKPREKLEALGAEALSKAELLAILIGSGSADEDAVALTKRILADVGDNLYELGKLSITDLQRYKGIGPAKAITIKAACELGNRRAMEKSAKLECMNSSQAVADYLKHQMRELQHEECRILVLDNALRLKANVLVSKGAADKTLVDIRTILYELIQHRAVRFIFAHNHPAESNRPSQQDDDITRRLVAAAEAIQIPLIDHIIIAGDNFYSYADNGKL